MAMIRGRMHLQDRRIAGLQQGKEEGTSTFHAAILQSCNCWECTMRMMRARRLFMFALVFAAVSGATFIARPYVRGASFVVRAADMHGVARRVADLDAARVSEREMTIPTR